MSELEDLYKKYEITRKDVLAWAQEKYPQFLRNERVLAQLYLRQAKRVAVEVGEVVPLRGKEVLVDDLKEDEWCIINVLIGMKIRENSYAGCPECMKKVDGEYCPTHGHVEPVTNFWHEYIAGDNSGDVTLSFPPRLANDMEDIEGQVFKLRGVMNDQGSFLVQEMKEIKTQIPVALLDKKVDDTLANEVGMLKDLLAMWTDLPYTDLQRWHKERRLKTKLPQLIAKAGFTVKDGAAVKKEEEAPVVSPAPPEAPPKKEEKPKCKKEAKAEAPQPPELEEAEVSEEREEPSPEVVVDPAEVKKLNGILSVISELKMNELREWHAKTGVKTPLEALIRACGCVVEGETIKRA